jgi:hypothetical protein
MAHPLFHQLLKRPVFMIHLAIPVLHLAIRLVLRLLLIPVAKQRLRKRRKFDESAIKAVQSTTRDAGGYVTFGHHHDHHHHHGRAIKPGTCEQVDDTSRSLSGDVPTAITSQTTHRSPVADESNAEPAWMVAVQQYLYPALSLLQGSVMALDLMLAPPPMQLLPYATCCPFGSIGGIFFTGLIIVLDIIYMVGCMHLLPCICCEIQRAPPARPLILAVCPHKQTCLVDHASADAGSMMHDACTHTQYNAPLS